MKLILIAFLALFISINISLSAENNPPDLSLFLPQKKPLRHVEMKFANKEYYDYDFGANPPFDKICSQLQEFLGEKWTSKQIDPVTKDLMKIYFNKKRRKATIDVDRYEVFTNPEFPGYEISILAKKIPANIKMKEMKTLVSVSIHYRPID